MSSQKDAIVKPSISIKSSEKLKAYINQIKIVDNLPIGLSNIVLKNKVKNEGNSAPPKFYQLINEEDEKFIKSLRLDSNKDILKKLPFTKTATVSRSDNVLSLEDLHSLYVYIKTQNQTAEDKVWLHELIDGSQIILPKKEEIPRNEELEKRCRKLAEQQANNEYFKITKNVDNKRQSLPENDTIGYQLQQMKRHLVAAFQFIMSVVASFVFGFVGVELLIGRLDFGFRLLLGIVCAVTVALAELYFLTKKLSEDLQYEHLSYRKMKVNN